jgi:hypothetical protein
MRQGRPELTLNSDLVGLRIDLPPPFAKPAATAWPMHWHSAPGGTAVAPRDSLQFDLGEVLKLRYQRDLSAARPRVLSGAIAIFDTLPTPGTGVQARLKLGRVNVDDWRALLAKPAAPAAAAADAPADTYLPQSLSLRADELVAGIVLPPPAADAKHYYRKGGTRAAQAISKVVVAGIRATGDVRLVWGSVAATTVGTPRTEAALAAGASPDDAAAMLMEEISPLDDIRSTRAYRLAVARNLVKDFASKTS